MPGLKDFFEFDLQATFFNLNEFATIENFDDIPITAVVAEDDLEKYNYTREVKGLRRAEVLFYAKKSEFTKRPIIGNRCTFNKKTYFIQSLTEDKGLLTVILEGNKA